MLEQRAIRYADKSEGRCHLTEGMGGGLGVGGRELRDAGPF